MWVNYEQIHRQATATVMWLILCFLRCTEPANSLSNSLSQIGLQQEQNDHWWGLIPPRHLYLISIFSTTRIYKQSISMQSMACKDQRCWVNTPQTREGRTHERIAKIEASKTEGQTPEAEYPVSSYKTSWYIKKWNDICCPFRLTRRRVIILLPKQKRAIGPAIFRRLGLEAALTNSSFCASSLQCKSIIKMTRRKLLMTLWYLSYGRYTLRTIRTRSLVRCIRESVAGSRWYRWVGPGAACRHSTQD
jgi:hypothetical protein